MSQCQGQIRSIDSELGVREALDTLGNEIQAQKDRLHQLTLQQRSEEVDAESVRAQVHDVEAKLYGGIIKNLREVEASQKEAGFLREHLKVLDDRVLETMMAAGEGQERLQSLEDSLRQAEEAWPTRQTQLADERERNEKTLTALEGRRQELVARVGQVELKLYENLRQSKSGQAIAKVERGLCRGCRMALPTHQLQRARAGRETVLCNSCGRILYVS